MLKKYRKKILSVIILAYSCKDMRQDMRSIFGLFTGLCIVSLSEVAYLRVIIIMHTSRQIDKNKTKHRVPRLPM